MIDFACKEFHLEDIIKCGLGLTKADYKILRFFMEKDTEWLKTENISKKLNLNLTTSQRAVKKLYDKQVLERSQNNLNSGGYVFCYKIRPKNEIREIILALIKKWHSKVEDALKKWEKN